MFQKKLKRDLANELGQALQNRQENLSKHSKNSRKRLLLINEAQIETLKKGSASSNFQQPTSQKNCNPESNTTKSWQIASLKNPQEIKLDQPEPYPPVNYQTNSYQTHSNSYDYPDASVNQVESTTQLVVNQGPNYRAYPEANYAYDSVVETSGSEYVHKKSYLGQFLLVILILMILTVLGIGSFRFVQDQQIQAQKTATQCQELINQQEGLGLNLNCQKVDSSIWGVWNNRNLASELAQNKQKIEAAKQTLAGEIKSLQDTIATKTTQIENLKITLPPGDPSQLTGLVAQKSQALARLDQLDSALLANLQQKAKQLDQLIKESQDLSDLNLEKYQKFLTDLQKKAGLTDLNSQSKLDGNQNVDFSVTNSQEEDLVVTAQEATAKIEELQDQIDQYLTTNPEQSQARLIKLYQNLNGNQFKEIYNNFKYSKVGPIVAKTVVLADAEADEYIAKTAESRGYLKRPQAEESKLEKVGEQKLQTEAKQAFEQLKLEASKQGLDMVLVSGYRSVSEQRDIFVQRLGNLADAQTIKNGQSDQVLDTLLQTTSVPGYSRHHTGYTFDLGCGSNDLIIFKETKCYQWLSRDNYLNAKRFGLIPSYPVGAQVQGPDPEAWEYVWVGTEVLKKK